MESFTLDYARTSTGPNATERAGIGIFSGEVSKYLGQKLMPVEFEIGTVIEEVGAPPEYAYLIERGSAALCAIREMRRIPVALLGPNSFVAGGVFFATRRSPFQTVACTHVQALRIAASQLRLAFDQSPELSERMSSLRESMIVEMGRMTMAALTCTLIQRLAALLVILQDHCKSDDISTTQTVLADILVNRRPGVTEAIHALEGDCLIRTSRRLIQIRDRQGLIRYSNGAYDRSDETFSHQVSNS